MDRGTRRATRPMRWEKADGTVVKLAVGEVFYSFGSVTGLSYAVVVVHLKHMFVSTVKSIEDRSEPVEETEPCPQEPATGSEH